MNAIGDPTPDYRSEFHYPHGASIPFDAVVHTEQCYVNLSPERTCPRCGSNNTRYLEVGTTRTRVHHWKVTASAIKCNSCKWGYVNIEVID